MLRSTHFAITADQATALQDLPTGRDRLKFLQSDIAPHMFQHEGELTCITEYAWNAVHRCLTDGYLKWNNGTAPRNQVILGGENLYDRDDFVMLLKDPRMVRGVAYALPNITKMWMLAGYKKIPPSDYEFAKSEDDFEIAWDAFLEVKRLFDVAGRAGRYILFTVEQ